ncbi:MAG: DNA repair protein [Candidatus Brocadiae bacterium]|nr:DNA repair protein [Candidatus Brocadiia bacterium]
MNEHSAQIDSLPKEILLGKLTLTTSRPMNFDQTHLLRGYIGSVFPQYDLLHNHEGKESRLLYRYPLIQYKIIQGFPIILGIGEKAIQILEMLSSTITKLVIHGKAIPIQEKDLETATFPFGISSEERRYFFITPAILLNSQNYKNYKNSTPEEQNQILKKCLESNLISTSKGLEYTVPARIQARFSLDIEPVSLKGEDMLGFQGQFFVNFHIPDFLGIGKSSSRGYGTCLQI